MELNEKNRLVDEWLDIALSQHGSVEPPPGMEQRLTARLQAMPRQHARWQLWGPWAAAGALMLLGAVALVNYRHPNSGDTAANHAGPQVTAETRGEPPVLASPSRPKEYVRRRPAKAVTPHHWPAQFPSPQPLNEQEKLLVRYVQEKPREARLVAQAREELLKQDLLAFDPPKLRLQNSQAAQP
jgi:hypothetical protein